ncbi:MAG TPA: aminotransferase class V-fold PLP-dependent enzyme [Thermoleophilaceae bacterium]|nr:aminotransferase class V-fold PLP-dependent enzyme [Thermoleophilaceae bacterium]
MDLRSHFPVLERLSYLNAGSVGPVPAEAADAARAELDAQVAEGRGGKPSFDHMIELGDLLRTRVAAVMGCDTGELALTGATTDGVNTVLAGLELEPGDEILTTDEEHPGLLAPLGLAMRRRGVQVRVVPFDAIAAEVRAETRLVACSHVSWLNGKVVDTAGLREAGAPVLLDGAQGIGAIPVDVAELGCDYYAGSGQKWLCGPVGSGYLWVRGDRIEQLSPAAPGYGSLADPLKALELDLREGAARYDTGLPPSHQSAWALAALDVLEAPGLDAVFERAAALAERLAGALAAAGHTVAPRGRTTLVSWEAEDPEATVQRLAGEDIGIRNLPGTPYVRASVGAWCTEAELDRLAELA